MPKSNSFDDLIQKALQSQDFPALPKSILNTWQAPRSESSAKWLWILPSVVFVIGIGIGVELAPLGLSNAFSTIKSSLVNIWQSVPEGALMWAFALVIATVVFTFDGLRSALFRFR